jgi:ABC-type transporter Mla subunit MlaD
MVATKLGTLDDGKDEDEMRHDALFELSMTEPRSVEEHLAEESQVLETIDSKINNLIDNLAQFSSDVISRFDTM